MFNLKRPILKDYFIQLRAITMARLGNFLLLHFSYYFSKFTRRYWNPAMPFALSVEPTAYCNLHCPECPVGSGSLQRPQGNMSPDLFQEILKDCTTHTFWLNLYFQGEPLLYRHLREMIETAHASGMYTVLSTNGNLLSEAMVRSVIEAGLSRIIISLDGASAQTYERYRKSGDFEEVLRGIRRIVALRSQLRSSTPLIVLQFLVFGHNEHEIPAWMKLGKELGVDKLELKTAQVLDPDKPVVDLPRNRKWSRYHQPPSGGLMLKGSRTGLCYRSWTSAVISWDGRVLPCCYDKEAQYCLGQMPKESFREIWKGKNNANFRRRVRENRQEVMICRNCNG